MIRIAAAVLTYDMFRTGRHELFALTWDSICAGLPDAATVVTVGSTDGTQDDVGALGGIVDQRRSSIWLGMTIAIDWCLEQSPDIVLFSNDDIRYVPDWRPRLESFWAAAPENLKLVSLILEPSWPWNEVYRAETIGGERLLYRETAPAAAWTFRARDWPEIGPVPQSSPAEDVALSQRLRERGFDIGQLELAEHLGERRSTWGNPCWRTAKPLDRARWGLPGRRI